jgi:hypothetical protein
VDDAAAAGRAARCALRLTALGSSAR